MPRKILVFLLFGCLTIAGCGRRKYAAVPIKRLETSAPFFAKIENIVIITNITPPIAYIGLKTVDGRRISLGGETEEEQTVVQFAGTLSEGKSYEFPKTWLEFRGARKDTSATNK